MQKLRRHFVCYDPARAQAAQKVGAAWLLRAHFPNVKIGHVLDAGLCEWHPLCAEWRNPEYAKIAWQLRAKFKYTRVSPTPSCTPQRGADRNLGTYVIVRI
jgi:hypothetical protein